MSNQKKQIKKETILKRGHIVAFSILGVLFAAIVCFAVLWSTMKAGSINGYEVSLEEFELYAEQNKNQIGSYFYKKYGADVNQPDFWDTQFDGETPRERLIEKTKEDILEALTIRQLAKEFGIHEDVTYKEIKKSYAAENQERGDKTDSGQVVYGTTSYSMIQYLSYMETAATDDLKTLLLEGDLAPTEEQLREAYESLDDSYLDKGYEANLAVFSINDFSVQEEFETSLHEYLSEEISPEDTFKRLTQVYGDAVTYESREINTDYHKEDTESQGLYERYRDEPTGTITGPYYLYADSATYQYMYDKVDYGKLSFEESGRLPETKWINDQFDLYIQQKAKSSTINWNDFALKQRVKLS